MLISIRSLIARINPGTVIFLLLIFLLFNADITVKVQKLCHLRRSCIS